MGLEILKRREHVETIEYTLEYNRIGCSGGYSFPCDKDGNFFDNPSNPAMKVSYNEVKVDPNYTFKCISKNRYSHIEPAVGKCKCGRTVYLDYDYGHGIDCDCGRIYNMSGQELAPRSQWDDLYDEDSKPYCVEFGYAGKDY